MSQSPGMGIGAQWIRRVWWTQTRGLLSCQDFTYNEPRTDSSTRFLGYGGWLRLGRGGRRRTTCARHWVEGKDNNARESRAVRTGAGHFAAGVSPPGHFAVRPFRRRNTPTTLKANAPNFDQKGELLVYVSKEGGALGMVRLGSSSYCTY